MYGIFLKSGTDLSKSWIQSFVLQSWWRWKKSCKNWNWIRKILLSTRSVENTLFTKHFLGTFSTYSTPQLFLQSSLSGLSKHKICPAKMHQEKRRRNVSFITIAQPYLAVCGGMVARIFCLLFLCYECLKTTFFGILLQFFFVRGQEKGNCHSFLWKNAPVMSSVIRNKAKIFIISQAHASFCANIQDVCVCSSFFQPVVAHTCV